MKPKQNDDLLSVGKQWMMQIMALPESERAVYEQWLDDNNIDEFIQELRNNRIKRQRYLDETFRNNK